MTHRFHIRRFTPADRDWLIEAHRDHYTRVDGFDESFGELVTKVIDDFIAEHDPKTERGWVVVDNEGPKGCIFCVRLKDDVAKLRLFLLQEIARGIGQARVLLAKCTQFARDAGYREMKLWTHESHTAACALYKKTGWQLLDSYPVYSFGQHLVEQNWSIKLR